ncbi:MAG: hypothetical protein ACI8ZF_001040 [Candidatus Midichloriaceae bacterium]|jgi:hypothetical protein
MKKTFTRLSEIADELLQIKKADTTLDQCLEILSNMKGIDLRTKSTQNNILYILNLIPITSTKKLTLYAKISSYLIDTKIDDNISTASSILFIKISMLY